MITIDCIFSPQLVQKESFDCFFYSQYWQHIETDEYNTWDVCS